MKNPTPKTPHYLPEVKAQYESFPYPPRDPEDERRRLLPAWLSWLPRINHYCFRGRQDFDGARVLVAGAGTGDGTIFLAEQLRDRKAEVVSLDLSRASTDVARERARVRGLTHIRWVEDSLLNLPDLDLGTFDYINCSGVLHHLESPDEGLAALTSVLKPDGAMGIMLYGAYGRTGVYQMQALMRLVNEGEDDMDRRVANTRAVLANLPPGNWFKRGEALFQDHVHSGDAGLYDLLLHPRDRAYTVPELFDFVERAGLHLAEFVLPYERFRLDPASHTDDPDTLDRFRALEPRARLAAAELIAGDIVMHMVYLSRGTDTVARPDDPDNVPFFLTLDDAHGPEPVADPIRSGGGGPVRFQEPGFSFHVTPGAYTDAILREMDGLRTLPEVFAAARRRLGDPSLSDAALWADFEPVYRQLNRADRILLRHRSVRPYVTPGERHPDRPPGTL